MRLIIQPAVGANPVRLIRSNLMWCLKTLPVQLFDSPSTWGLYFNVKFRGQNLYFGRLDNRNRPLLTLDANNPTGNALPKGAQEKRALIEQTSNTSTVYMNIPGQGDAVIDVDFHFLAGSQLPKTGIFSLILDFIFSLAPYSISNNSHECTYQMPI